MKKILIVNNNMKVGGVQKSLNNLLWSVADCYDITLYLFSATGELMESLPPSVRVETCASPFRFLGISQSDCKGMPVSWLLRGALAAACRLFGRAFVIRLMDLGQKALPDTYDVAISYLQNGSPRSFYGGVNEFVLRKVRTGRKVAYLHCDYGRCGANNPANNRLYSSFDVIAACSEGCRRSFLGVVPELADRCVAAPNFHRYELIRELAHQEPVSYQAGRAHLLVVGRLAHEKAVDRAIRATARCVASGISASLHIVGDGNMRQGLESLVEELGAREYVHFYGEQGNPYRYMTNASLLLVTSYHEAAPMVIEEARSIGLPVLTVETTSSKEMVLDTGCGWVCKNSQDGLDETLQWLLSNGGALEETRARLRRTMPDNALAERAFQAVVEGRDD